MRTRTFDRFAEKTAADDAIIDWFTQRNEGRGQYPKRFTPKRQMRELFADGTTIHTYTYKGEVCEKITGAYAVIVNFDAPINTIWSM